MTVAGETHRCPPSEVLAAFIDGRLPRMKVVALTEHLASCAECRFVVESASELEAEAQAEVEPKERHSWRWMAVAAMVGVVVLTVPFVATMREPISATLRAGVEWVKSPRAYAVKSSVRELIAAANDSNIRLIEPRITGFGYGERPGTFRGDEKDPDDHHLVVGATASAVLMKTEKDQSPEAVYAHGIASLVMGYKDKAIADLITVTQRQPRNAQAWSDLAAAYLRNDQRKEAIDAANHALALDPKLNEARFNKALAIDNAEKPAESIAEWTDYLRHDPYGEWALEARQRRRYHKEGL